MLIKILFEFHHFFKLQNVIKSQIHFNTSTRGGEAYIQGMYFFCLQVDSSDTSKGGARGAAPPPPPPSQGRDPALARPMNGGAYIGSLL